MDDTPEEFLGLVDPAPPSPSVFLDLPPTPHGDGDPSSQPQDDMALDYISRMFMEEDMDDRFFYQYPNHPALLQAQQSLVHVISSPSSSSVHTNDTSSKLCPDMMQGSAFLAGEADNTDLSGDVRSFSSDVAVQNLLFSHNAAEEAKKLLKVGTGDQTVLSSAPLSGAENINENVEYSDDPALLQAQQPFAQILSTISSGTNNDNTQPVGCAASLQGADRGNLEEAKGLLPGANGDLSMLSSAFSNSVDVVGAFLKGMEEASKFLPEDNGFRRDEVVDQMFRESGTGRGCKNRYDREEQLEEAVGKTSKRMLMMADPKEVVAQMFDNMMLDSVKTCIKDKEELRMAMDKKAEKKNSKGRSKAKRKVVDLRMLLIQCAQAVAMDSHRSAGELLKEIKKHASPTGDAMQRLAHCFARGLEARLAGSGSQLCQLLTSKRISAVNFLKAYKVYTAASCFNRVAFTFSTMTIVHAVAGKSRLHIVDYGMLYGLQWASLLYLLANREGGPPEVKITAIGLPQHGGQVEETECRLSNCAREFGLPFKFYAIASKWETVQAKDLDIDPDEVLVVNDLFKFRTLMDESVFFDSPSPRDAVLNNIRKMRPDVFIQSIGNTSYGNTFLSRFREALFYYSALFDMLDATIPRESEPRLVLEQDILGRTALNVIACQGTDLVERPERYRQWQARNQRAGLRQLPLNPDIVKVVRDTVRKCHHKDFLLGEDQQWLLQGWKGCILFAHSTWVAEDTSSR